MNTPGFNIGQLVRMIAGMIVWASAFVMLYAGFSIGCQVFDVPVGDGLANPVTALLLLITALHGGVLLFLLWFWHRHPVQGAEGESERSRRFRHRVEGLVLLVSLTALVWIAFPVAMLAPCTG